jgi:adenylosuccinate lyase
LSDSPISPVDGRYYPEVKELSEYFSEEALVNARAEVEMRYLKLLVRLGIAPKRAVPRIRVSFRDVKKIEAKTGHDVKALELYLRGKLEALEAPDLSPFVHLGLTSEDVNNLAYGMTINGALRSLMVPAYEELSRKLSSIAVHEAETPMLARTHGRPALPTTFGKEMANFAIRLAGKVGSLKASRIPGKLSGAVGSYASFKLLSPDLNWPRAFAELTKSLGLDYSEYTTQVLPAEATGDVFHHLMGANVVMLNLSRDLWLYQMLDFVRFDRGRKVSSSTMPQKTNPVDLENAEGQVEISNSILSLLAYRVPVSRLQRDLSDSPLKRMTGQALAHSLIAAKRLVSSLGHMKVDRRIMASDLSAHPEVFSEPAQLLMRLRGDSRGYEKVRRVLERGPFLIPGEVSERIGEYLGLAPQLARDSRAEVERLLRGPRPA